MNVTPVWKSPKARGRDRYAKARRDVQKRAGGRCEAACCEQCTGQGGQAHHVRRRSQGGADDPSNLLWVCGPCHSEIHARPEWAREEGFLARMFDAAPAVGYVVPATRLYDQDADA
jgi:hypothetical protein